MDETSTTAMLVGTRDMLAEQSNALTATVSRDEIEGALAAEPPNDLILEILRSVEGRDELERHTLNVAWDRTDLESVLSDGDADAITFSFDPDELQRILSEPDVEGHGLREAAVVLSIAAAAAVGGPSVASAEPGGAWAPQAQAAVSGHDESTLTARGIESGTVAAAHDESTLTARGIESGTVASTAHDESTLAARGIEPGTVAAASAHDESTLAARGIEPATVAAASAHDESTLAARGIEPGTVAAASTHDESTLAARGIEPGTLAAAHDESTLAARGIEPGTLPAVHDETTLAARGIEPATLAAAHDESTLAARGIEPGTLPAVHDETTLAARGIEPAPTGAEVAADAGPSFDLSWVDPGFAAGIAGALAAFGLAIAGASFASRRREPGPA